MLLNTCCCNFFWKIHGAEPDRNKWLLTFDPSTASGATGGIAQQTVDKAGSKAVLLRVGKQVL